MREIDKLILEMSLYEARTGKSATVSITSEYLKKLTESERHYIKAEGYIAGIPLYVDNEQSEDYIIR
jgi:hypothetical protein